MDLAELTNTLVDLLRSQKDGLSNEDLERYFGARFAALPPILNNLLDLKRLNLYTRDGNLLYKLVEEETAAKFEGLGDQQILVYQVCEKAGSRGVWTRDIKTATNIPQHTLTKTLKLLEQRNLIKSVRSVVSKSKKLYMLYDIVPAKEITGGPWYTDQEFDQAFVDDLTATILHDCKGNQQLDRKGILDKLSGRAIEQSTLSLDELDTLLQTLVYDKQLESVKTAPALGAASAAPLVKYKLPKYATQPSQLVETPCGVCQLISQCSEGGVISPTTCVYMNDWLLEKVGIASGSQGGKASLDW